MIYISYEIKNAKYCRLCFSQQQNYFCGKKQDTTKNETFNHLLDDVIAFGKHST